MDNLTLLESLRDFFHYGRKEHLRQAYLSMTAAGGIDRSLEEIDWDLEEFTFNRLFIGPMAPLAPAVASVYLDPEGLIQGEVTAKIRNFYQSIGLSLEEVGSEPEDSIAYELDACRHLLHLGRDVPEALEVFSRFFKEHIARWVPEFSARATERCADSVAVKDVLRLLSGWVESENCRIVQHEEMK